MIRPTRVVLTWTAQDLLGLAALLGIWAIALGACLYQRPAELRNPPAVQMARVEQVREEIDPNTACLASLRRLPLVGQERAEAILRYRASASAGGKRAFETLDDLEKVHGIGPGTVRRMAEFLSLKSSPTLPASRKAKIADR